MREEEEDSAGVRWKEGGGYDGCDGDGPTSMEENNNQPMVILPGVGG